MNERILRIRLWMKLAAFAACGIVIMHAIYLTIASRITSRALASQQARLGQNIAHHVAEEAAEPLLLEDAITLDELVSSVVDTARPSVVYCFITRSGTIAVSSFDGPPPAALTELRRDGDRAPIVVVSGERRILDVVEVVPSGLGEVRLGLDMTITSETRESLGTSLGLLAVGMIAVGTLAALIVGRRVSRPIHEILGAADHFDPAREGAPPLVRARGTDEISELGRRFNQMLVRLQAAQRERERARQRHVETERMAALGSLVAGITHEVNNPLAGIKNCVHRLSRADLSPEKRTEYLGLMEEGLAALENVVRQLLDFARPHAPKLEWISASDLAERASHLIAPQLARRKIQVQVVGLDANGPVRADRHAIGQSLLNLLLNAAYVTEPGGEIRLRIVHAGERRGIAVEDDGPGVPAEIRERILDPFFTTKPPGEGTGLGLSVTRTIVDAHGGELTFEFPARGTIATVWLPSREPVASA
ncbi:ATP-binding protein [Myxococcota bacterium]|nr:ATP-binding protein [Myxococcota bacterium]